MSNGRSQFVEKVTGEHVAAENRKEPLAMGTIKAHEFMSLDGVIDAPTWTFDYGFDPAMGQDIGNLMSSCEAHHLEQLRDPRALQPRNGPPTQKRS